MIFNDFFISYFWSVFACFFNIIRNFWPMFRIFYNFIQFLRCEFWKDISLEKFLNYSDGLFHVKMTQKNFLAHSILLKTVFQEVHLNVLEKESSSFWSRTFRRWKGEGGLGILKQMRFFVKLQPNFENSLFEIMPLLSLKIFKKMV